MSLKGNGRSAPIPAVGGSTLILLGICLLPNVYRAAQTAIADGSYAAIDGRVNAAMPKLCPRRRQTWRRDLRVGGCSERL